MKLFRKQSDREVVDTVRRFQQRRQLLGGILLIIPMTAVFMFLFNAQVLLELHKLHSKEPAYNFGQISIVLPLLAIATIVSLGYFIGKVPRRNDLLMRYFDRLDKLNQLDADGELIQD